MQTRYWNKLTQFKFSLFYLEDYMLHSVTIDRTLKIILAIASSSAIAAWTRWQNLSFAWSLVIVVSQVISATNEFLPYKKRINEISDLKSELTPIYYDMEKNWKKVSDGTLSENEINELCYSFVQEYNEVNERYFKDDSLPQRKKIKKKAELQKNAYFMNNF